MRLPSYLAYRESAVQWLGKVPNHWEVVQSRRYFFERKEKALAVDQQLTASQKYGILYQSEYMEREGKQVVQVITGADILKHAEPNDFVISMRSFQGGLEWCKYSGSISSAYVMVTPQGKIEPSFYRYLFKCAPYIQALQTTSNLVRDGQALRFSNFAQVNLPLPPILEQIAIATFLDRETTKIDVLISEQEKLIALLAEKRQATISRIVTTGLNPDVPTKDSGVEWLGEVPEHWAVKRIRFIAELNPSKSEIAGMDRAMEVSFLPMDAIGDDGTIQLEKTRLISEVETGYTYFRNDDVVVAKITPCFENGKGAVMRGLLEDVGFGTTELIVVRPLPDEANSDYLHWIFMSTPFRKLGEGSMYGAGGQKRVPDDFVRNFQIAFAPVHEQTLIVAFLEEETGRVDTLTAEANRGIDLLKERRSALISAAVTGKIDVRRVVQKWQTIQEAA